MTQTPGELLGLLTQPGGGSLAAVARELVGPLAGAATPEPLPWEDGTTAQVTVPGGTRYPVLYVTLVTGTERDRVVAVPRLLARVAGAQQPPVTFEPWSQAGSSLPAYVPPVDEAGAAAEVRLSVVGTRSAADGIITTLSADEVRALLRVDLVQGLTGRVLAAVLGEKVRLRRTAREIASVRALADARADALDRVGRDLGVPRFADELVWDADRRSPATRPLSPPGRLEDDSEYRDRLRLLRGWRLPTPAWGEDVLNGSGLPARVEVDESRNPIHVAFRLVSPGSAQGRLELLDSVRKVHLVWPAGSTDGDAAHAGRLLPQRVRDQVAGTRAALARWSVPDHQPLAPGLARALELLDARCGQLGARPWPSVLAGQQDDGGSRFELGLGSLLAATDATALDKAVTAAEALGDPALPPRKRADDPIGAWLLTACGLRTAEPTPDGTVFISVLPMGPLIVDLSHGPDAALPVTATARLVAVADTSRDAPMAAVVAAMQARGLQTTDVTALLDGMQQASTAPALAQALAALGVPCAELLVGFRTQLEAVSDRLYAGFDLGPAGTAAISADPTQLAATLGAAAAAGASSVVTFLSAAGTVVLLVGVTGLPLAGSNLAARQTVLYRWEARGLAGQEVLLDPRRGPRTDVYEAGAGIGVVSCLAHIRGLGNDPYEWRPALPDGALLDLRQYEHLLNLVELTTPVGVRANTWELRQRHVDVDGSGKPFPLTATAARTYRRYRTER